MQMMAQFFASMMESQQQQAEFMREVAQQKPSKIKTLFAAQQLHVWLGHGWANHVASMGTDRQITWDEFKDAFRAHYIPAGLIRRKAREFAALKQGNRSVEEYCEEEFNRLALYARTSGHPRQA
ncbi:hypothetical protein PR202_ga24498 [Eleusine coracana subsp. coracana]|uniref:Retrotransposon gag domain-containing protein n=1 Tax=Eleusine coracana subsp. coracana TaxID=191504 RepID=A0AAV5D912_ELECO|nr:hypothetical protein PR202_ga24498 [Eleusine coracana subsp. coracana]